MSMEVSTLHRMMKRDSKYGALFSLRLLSGFITAAIQKEQEYDYHLN